MKWSSSGYMVPWGMSCDMKGYCYLNNNYTVHPRMSGTVDLLVMRDSKGLYHLDISKCRDHVWKREAYRNDNWFGILVNDIIGAE